MTRRRQPWPTERKMPALIDGQLSLDQLRQAIAVLHGDAEETPMTLSEVVDWLELHVRRSPHPPAPSTPPGTRGARTRRRYRTPAGRPGRLHRQEASQAA